MTHHDPVHLKETLNRAAKIDVDSGAAPDFDTAVSRLRGHRIQVLAGPEVAESEAHQAALLTVINIARRFALGGVLVHGALDTPSLMPRTYGSTLDDAVRTLGGVAGELDHALPTIVVGTTGPVSGRGVAVTFEGWRGGVVRLGARRLGEATTVIPAAVLAGGIAAGEAFAMLRGEVEAGRRAVGLSLWRPADDWLASASDGPTLTALPDHLWVLGLGHLGQAFLWTLLLCHFPDPSRVRLTLQDMDFITGSTDSTSILTQPSMIRRRKTRALAEVLEARGFSTTLIERPFNGRFEHDPKIDPAVLVCGVDNALARARLEIPRFPLVVEAGLGHSAKDYRAMRLHTFPSQGKGAAELWGAGHAAQAPTLDQPAYRALAEGGSDICGLTQLAQTAVGVPFVGTVAGTLMLAQLLRLLARDPLDIVLDLDLGSLRSRRVVRGPKPPAAVPSFQTLRYG